MEIGKLAFMLLYYRIVPDFIFYHENTKGGKHETPFPLILFSFFRAFVIGFGQSFPTFIPFIKVVPDHI